ncbi:hypothetical protein [Brevibacterium linens]|uniref:hypothetical protein n=1 Tax=Brevibacterium linens TaxID=1703 RepID=UPI000FC9C6A1|nr:hypothetical protein [Brevibacterium linens]AZU01705.1 hypothetical protein CXR29_14195 [Brevibacterium linens]
MPDRPSGAEEADRDRESVDSDRGPTGPSDDGASTDSDSTSSEDDDAEAEADGSRKARIAAAKRRYRATLRNEADTGGGGFSEDYYRSQKPPHWS